MTVSEWPNRWLRNVTPEPIRDRERDCRKEVCCQAGSSGRSCHAGKRIGVNRSPPEPRATAGGLQESTHEMAIGRTDERHDPLLPAAIIGRPVVWMSLTEPIWASGHGLASKAGHMTAFKPEPVSRETYLNPMGRPHMVLCGTPIAVAAKVARIRQRRDRTPRQLRAAPRRSSHSGTAPGSTSGPGSRPSASCAGDVRMFCKGRGLLRRRSGYVRFFSTTIGCIALET